MTLSNHYNEGKLTNAVTRGDGTTGEDILRNASKMGNVLHELDDLTVKEVIGEVLVTRSVWNTKLSKKLKKNGEPKYKAIRNAGTGIAKRFKKSVDTKYLTVRYFNLITGDKLLYEVDKFKKLSELGFKNVLYKSMKGSEFIEYYDRQLAVREHKNYEADGLVVTVNSIELQEKLGRDSRNNPNYSIAVKFPYPMKETKLRKIEWSIGNDGRLTPVAVVKAVDLGATVTRASLANNDIILKLWEGSSPRRGDVVRIARSGDVIPKIVKIVSKGKGPQLLPPTICTVCDSPIKLRSPYLYCSNADCASLKLGNLTKWINTLKVHCGVKGIGPERIAELFEAGLIEYPHNLYELTPEKLTESLEGVLTRSANNILSFQKVTTMPLAVLLGGLNIIGVGVKVFQLVVDAGFDTFEKMMDVTPEQLITIDGFSRTRANTLVAGILDKLATLSYMMDYIDIESNEVEQLSASLEGKSFLFTGKISRPRKEFENMVIANGGIIKGVSKNLDYLVAGDKAGSKLAKAEKLGISILNEQQFLEMVGS